MVKRYDLGDEYMAFIEDGDYVLYSDYLALQKALEEAITCWEEVITNSRDGDRDFPRISELRTQFLEKA